MFETVFSVMRNNEKYVDYLAERLVSIGESVHKRFQNIKISKDHLNEHSELYNINTLQDDIFVAPGSKAPNRMGVFKVCELS